MLKSKGHINNLYNTTFWALIQQGGMDAKAAEKELAVCCQTEGLSAYADFLRALLQERKMRFCSPGSKSITTMSRISTRRVVWYTAMCASPLPHTFLLLTISV